MRNIDAGQITLCIEELFKSACREYPPEVVPALNRAAQDEDTARAAQLFESGGGKCRDSR